MKAAAPSRPVGRRWWHALTPWLLVLGFAAVMAVAGAIQGAS